ncbi:MAG: hypothetical protein IJ141_05830 [Lachnospiraceae bacterium]|nr:hypothetical protein [Lachnospiraceae bacterium]
MGYDEEEYEECYVVVNTLDCSDVFSGTWDDCSDYLDKHQKDTLAGTLTIETFEDYTENLKYSNSDLSGIEEVYADSDGEELLNPDDFGIYFDEFPF